MNAIEVSLAVLMSTILTMAVISGIKNAQMRDEREEHKSEVTKLMRQINSLSTLVCMRDRQIREAYESTHQRCIENAKALEESLENFRAKLHHTERRLEAASKGEQLINALKVIRGDER